MGRQAARGARLHAPTRRLHPTQQADRRLDCIRHAAGLPPRLQLLLLPEQHRRPGDQGVGHQLHQGLPSQVGLPGAAQVGQMPAGVELHQRSQEWSEE